MLWYDRHQPQHEMLVAARRELEWNYSDIYHDERGHMVAERRTAGRILVSHKHSYTGTQHTGTIMTTLNLKARNDNDRAVAMTARGRPVCAEGRIRATRCLAARREMNVGLGAPSVCR
jgi:hypothetical protein